MERVRLVNRAATGQSIPRTAWATDSNNSDPSLSCASLLHNISQTENDHVGCRRAWGLTTHIGDIIIGASDLGVTHTSRNLGMGLLLSYHQLSGSER